METEIDNTCTVDGFSICITQFCDSQIHYEECYYIPQSRSNSMINHGLNDIGLKPFVDELGELCNITVLSESGICNFIKV